MSLGLGFHRGKSFKPEFLFIFIFNFNFIISVGKTGKWSNFFFFILKS